MANIKKIKVGTTTYDIYDATAARSTHNHDDKYVAGPSSSTANAVPRYDDITGKKLKDSGVTISDANVLSAAQLAANIIETGTGDNNYFQSRKFRGEGNAATYYHAVDFGFAGHNQVDFYEYGGLWNFWKNTDATATTASSNLCLQIGDTYIKNKGNTFTWPTTSGTIALAGDPANSVKNALTFGSKTYNGSSAQTITLADLGGQVAGNYALKNEIIAKSLITTKGDMIYASAANTPTRLGIGSNGQFLSIANGIPKWVNNPNTHQSIKTLKTDNTAAQATSASEAIAGSGTINLHKVAKTGSYNDLNNKPNLDAKADNHRHFKSGDSGRDNGVYTYYKLASFPIDNAGNSCSLTVDGRIGGWNNGNKGYLSMIISNRDGIAASGTLIGNALLNELCDLVVYTSGATSTNSTATLYVKTYSWFAFDLTLGAMNGAEDVYDGNGVTTTPTGTLA